MTLRQKVDTWVACVFFSDVRLQIPAPGPDTLQEARIGQGVLENSKQKQWSGPWWCWWVAAPSRAKVRKVDVSMQGLRTIPLFRGPI